MRSAWPGRSSSLDRADVAHSQHAFAGIVPSGRSGPFSHRSRWRTGRSSLAETGPRHSAAGEEFVEARHAIAPLLSAPRSARSRASFSSTASVIQVLREMLPGRTGAGRVDGLKGLGRKAEVDAVQGRESSRFSNQVTWRHIGASLGLASIDVSILFTGPRCRSAGKGRDNAVAAHLYPVAIEQDPRC